MNTHASKSDEHHHSDTKHYFRLVGMAVLSFMSMYALMYAMVDRFANVYSNFNQFYMAALMTAPMIVFEILLMGMMYKNRKWNAIILGVSVVVLFSCWMLVRKQMAIGDEEFLRSMIPHRAGALLMCGEAPIYDAEIQELCSAIIASQQSEIDQMKTILERLNK